MVPFIEGFITTIKHNETTDNVDVKPFTNFLIEIFDFISHVIYMSFTNKTLIEFS